MKTIGFPISHKENEFRRCLVPSDITKDLFPEQMYFEKGYGEVLGIPDSEYEALGCHMVSRKEALSCDVVADPKIGDGDYLGELKEGQTIFGWVHATQSREITDTLLNNRLTAYAWENMFDMSRDVFWRNNELAGEAAVLHAFQIYGMMPYEANVAIIGNGNAARGAMKCLSKFGASVHQYSRRTEDLLRKELGLYDVIVNCVRWDVNRDDHIISKEDLKRMKRNALIIDVSCDRNGGVETSIPTTIEDPMYAVDTIQHYVVDHTPSLYYKTFTFNNSKVIAPYIRELITGEIGPVLGDALVVTDGKVIDQSIDEFQGR